MEDALSIAYEELLSEAVYYCTLIDSLKEEFTAARTILRRLKGLISVLEKEVS
jgi:hypothetical protein